MEFGLPQSLSFILIHYIFSTKDRRPWFSDLLRRDLHSYLATMVRNTGCECYRVGGIEDHVHLAVRQARTITVASLVEEMKTSTSKWIKTQSPDLSDFAWQRGYGAFSVGPADLQALCNYIDNQQAHHETHTFQEEYRAFLKKYGVDFDEKYVWD